MSQPDTKRVKTDEAPYELIYWGGLPGRGEFIRLLFEEAGVPYSDDGKNAGEAAKKVLGILGGETPIGSNPPPLAPPILRHGDVLLSQTSNILQYLAPKLGLAPSEGAAVYHLNQIVLTLMDGFVNEMHDTHHAIAVALTYEEQQPESDKRAKYYLSGRLPKYLAYAQSLLDAKTSGEGPWLYGSNLTYADLVLFQAIDGTQYAFPKSVEKLKKSGEYDGVFKLYDAVKERPNIKEYLASERRQAYGNGIWRHYPQQQEEE